MSHVHSQTLLYLELQHVELQAESIALGQHPDHGFGNRVGLALCLLLEQKLHAVAAYIFSETGSIPNKKAFTGKELKCIPILLGTFRHCINIGLSQTVPGNL